MTAMGEFPRGEDMTEPAAMTLKEEVLAEMRRRLASRMSGSTRIEFKTMAAE
jgi:hypothetical protein